MTVIVFADARDLLECVGLSRRCQLGYSSRSNLPVLSEFAAGVIACTLLQDIPDVDVAKSDHR